MCFLPGATLCLSTRCKQHTHVSSCVTWMMCQGFARRTPSITHRCRTSAALIRSRCAGISLKRSHAQATLDASQPYLARDTPMHAAETAIRAAPAVSEGSTVIEEDHMHGEDSPQDREVSSTERRSRSQAAAAAATKQHDTRMAPRSTQHACANSDSACLLYTSPSPRDQRGSRMPSSA